MIPFILTSNSIQLVIDFRPVTIHSTMPEFAPIQAALKVLDWNLVRRLADKATAINKAGKGRVRVVNGEIQMDGEPLHHHYGKRILDLHYKGFPVDHMLLHLEKLMANPSMQVREELPLFLEAANLPLAEDGDFLAYKVVRSDYLDKHSGKIRNKVGDAPFMKREQVCDDRRVTCAQGLHFAALEYITKMFGRSGDRVMVLKVNPIDVVSIPYDYNNQKGRAWRYKVVAEAGVLGKNLRLLPNKPVVNVDSDDDYVFGIAAE